MAPPPTHDCSIALLPWLPGFPPQAFPTTISALTSPQSISPQSTASLNSSCSHCPFQETQVPAQHMYGCSQDCLSLIPFRLPQISCFTLSLKCFFSDSDSCPPVGIRPPASVPLPTKGRSSPTNTLVFPPKSFILPSFAWVYIFFSTGQVLLSALHCCSECTSGSEGVFPMYPWRQMYSMSTYPLPSCSLKASYLYQTLSHAVKAKVLLEYYRYYCY